MNLNSSYCDSCSAMSMEMLGEGKGWGVSGVGFLRCDLRISF